MALIDTVREEIDLAAYVLTDWPVIQALTRAADWGVKIRIYLDGTQLGERELSKVFHDLADMPGVEIRTISRATRLTAGCCAPAPRTFQPRDSSVRTMI